MNATTNCASFNKIHIRSCIYVILKVIYTKSTNWFVSSLMFCVESELILLPLASPSEYQGLRTASCCSPSQSILPAAPTIVSLDEDRRDASQKYYIGYRYVAQSDKEPERGPADSVVSRRDGIAVRFYFRSQVFRWLNRQTDILVGGRDRRDDVSCQREKRYLRWSPPRGIPQAFSRWGSRASWHRLAIWTTRLVNDPVCCKIVIIWNCFL